MEKYQGAQCGFFLQGLDLGPWAQIWAHGTKFAPLDSKFGPWAQIWTQIQPV